MILKINNYDEKTALLSALWSREDSLIKEITKSAIEMATDKDDGGQEYWIEKTMDLGVDLHRIQSIEQRVNNLEIISIEPPASDEEL